MLPQLLYLADVPVEASYHGAALLHRLLSNYPRGKLRIFETGKPSEPARRLSEVDYINHPIGRARWLNTRFHPYAVAWYTLAGKRVAPRISHSLNGFNFEDVLTVAHGFGWLAAAAIANKRKARLHLMIHDDWPRVADVAPPFRGWLEERFAEVYRQAQTRFCVSPSMSCFYEERYRAPATVIYPSRALDGPEFEDPPPRLANNDKPFTIAFAGTINSNGYIEALRAVQRALKPIGGRLVIFGPLTAALAEQIGLNDPHTEICGLLRSDQLVERLREEADTLFVPMSFAGSDRSNMELAFPSKLADYTATGAPLLIYGPRYCSAVAWARENTGVAEVVETQSEISNAVERLATDPQRRITLGKRALEVGREYFTHARVQEVFHQALSVPNRG